MILWKSIDKDETIWHSWFAWRPVWIDNELVWLEKVWRRRDDGYSWWEYCK